MYQQSKVLIQHLLAQITRAWTMTSSAIHGRITIFTIFSYFLLINGAATVLNWIFGTAASQNGLSNYKLFFIMKPKLFKK
jgi:hypothetical protein